MQNRPRELAAINMAIAIVTVEQARCRGRTTTLSSMTAVAARTKNLYTQRNTLSVISTFALENSVSRHRIDPPSWTSQT